MPAQRYSFHEENTGFIRQVPEQVFATLDDHVRLAAHMTKRSWRTSWATTQIVTNPEEPRGVGAHIALRGRVLGFRLSVEEAVTRYEPPSLKEWETTEEPHLLVIGRYRMAFSTTSVGNGTQLRVTIDYNHPASGLTRLLGILFGRIYAKWCTSQMVSDAAKQAPVPLQ